MRAGIQLLSAQDLSDGKQPRMPGSRTAFFAQAASERKKEGPTRKLL